jgi:hypothetical protein
VIQRGDGLRQAIGEFRRHRVQPRCIHHDPRMGKLGQAPQLVDIIQARLK